MIEKQIPLSDNSPIDFDELADQHDYQGYLARLIIFIARSSNYELIGTNNDTTDYILASDDKSTLIFSAVKKHWVSLEDDPNCDLSQSSVNLLIKSDNTQEADTYLLYSMSTTGYVHEIREAYYNEGKIIKVGDKIRRTPENINEATSAMQRLWDNRDK